MSLWDEYMTWAKTTCSIGRFHDNTHRRQVQLAEGKSAGQGDISIGFMGPHSKKEKIYEGYKVELYRRKMKTSSWRLLEPSKRQLERLT